MHFARYFTFTLDEKTTIELTLESSADPYLTLLDNAGELVEENDDIDDDGQNFNSCITAALPAGDYIVEVITYNGAAAGDFTLSLFSSKD